LSGTSIDAVLPLTLKDWQRAELLFESLAHNFSDLGTVFIVCPDRQVEAITQRARDLTLALTLRVLPESTIVPEFALTPKLGGWYRQQLIKLSMFEHVDSELYLTLDADIICSRTVNASDLSPNNLGPCFVIEQELRRHWYERVERVLRVRAPRRGILHNVTPAVLHCGALLELKQVLNDKSARGEYSKGLRGLKQRWLAFKARNRQEFASWRVYLAGATPWTEYALYYTFLEATGRFSKYHFYSAYSIYDIERSLWDAGDKGARLATWDPTAAFIGAGPPWFVVAQSNTGIDIDAVRQKIEPLLHAIKR